MPTVEFPALLLDNRTDAGPQCSWASHGSWQRNDSSGRDSRSVQLIIESEFVDEIDGGEGENKIVAGPEDIVHGGGEIDFP